jgi:hypothetical protein
MKHMNTYNYRLPTRASIACSIAALTAAGMLLCGGNAQAQTSITGLYPDGLHQFESSPTISFTANSPTGVTNVSVTLSASSLLGGTYLPVTYSTGNGLTIGGTSTAETVSAPLSADFIYSATIVVADTVGSTSKTLSFDTIAPVYTWEAEDWDYTNNAGVSGQFFDNPQTNKYAGLGAQTGDDFLMENPGNGSASYRPQQEIVAGATNSVGLETQGTADLPRLPWYGSSPYVGEDYEIGYTDTGDFANYTRHYPSSAHQPAGAFNVYARFSDGSGNNNVAATLSVSSTAGNTQLIGNAPFSFSDKDTGWSGYAFYPLRDSTGALVQMQSDGSLTTLNLFVNSGSFNANYFMLVPADTNLASTTLITNMYPDGATQFQPSANLTFTVVDPAGVTSNGVTVILTGTNILGQTTNATVTTANGLTASGTDTNLIVSLPLAANTTYGVLVGTSDLTGNQSTTSWTFDTITPVYTWEAMDFDYSSNGGNGVLNNLYFDNPQTNAYYQLQAVQEFDVYADSGGIGHGDGYRQNPAYTTYGITPVQGPAIENTSDVPQQAFTNQPPNNVNPVTGQQYTQYDLGNNDSTEWDDYTRHYPNGVFNIYIRTADGGGSAGNGGAIGLVTSGVGTSSQTVSNWGSYSPPSTSGWQNWVWTPLTDAAGNLAVVTFATNESPETLRVYMPNSGNVELFMLMPKDTSLPTFTGLYPDGTAFFQQTNRLTFYANSSSGIATTNIGVWVSTNIGGANGTNAWSLLTFTGSAASWFVSLPLQDNLPYYVSISETNNAGITHSESVVFDTFSPTYYTMEPGDFNYTDTNGVSGKFFDNPQIDAYNGLAATPGIDCYQVLGLGGTVQGGAPNDYRNDTNADTYAGIMGDTVDETIPAGDLARAEFGTNATWLLRYFGYGGWAEYTRHFPAGSYNVWARMKNGCAGTTQETLWEVTGGWNTLDQQTNFLGAWSLPSEGWGPWYWTELMTTNASPEAAVVTFDGNTNTLLVGSSLVQDTYNCNVGFYMFVPVGVNLTVSASAGQITISFPTVSGKTYQVVSKPANNLNAATWTSVGGTISGNGSVQSVQYAIPTTPGGLIYGVTAQ